MRYVWVLFASVLGMVVAAASCSASGRASSEGSGTGTGGVTSGGGGTGNRGATGGSNGAGNGGSTGVFMVSDSGSDSPAMCPAYKDCQQQGLDCGTASDLCGNTIDCGKCSDPTETCGGGGTANVCGKPACTPVTCMSLGFDCGMTSDQCNGTLDCGACMGGQVCGSQMPNVCGNTICTPKTCMQQGFDCGMQGDGCGNAIDCGTCTGNQVCGGGMNPKPGVCGTTGCTPKTCMQQGFNCGAATDGCGNIIMCGTCGANEFCGGGGPNLCGSTISCTNLCLKQQVCPNNGTTSITGKVFAPQGVDPLPNTLVYVPNCAVQPFTQGVSCGSCGADVSGCPLVSAVTAVDGTFTITNMPVGANIPLVIQNGRWRRQFVIPNVPACVSTPLPTAGMPQIRMPQTHLEGDIPLMGFVTGTVDSLECVLRKIGIADTEFSDPAQQGGSGRVRFYVGATFGGGGAVYSVNTPSETQLWGTQAEINEYDMVYFACQGSPALETSASQQVVIDYANAGGRIFATHYSYDWLYNDAPFSGTANWTPNQADNFVGANMDGPELGYINTTFPKGLLLAQWLQVVGASTTLGQIQINTLRNDFSGVVAPSLLWMTVHDPNYANPVPMHYTFDTPVGAQPSQQCGRVLYDDFHVEDNSVAYLPPFFETPFPTECAGGAMTPQEKLLEFMIFDLGSCVTPPTCVPKTCAQANTMCGPVGDGCGNILQCGTCPSGQACVAGMCTSGCTPKTCMQQGFMCGQQGDGCGNIQNCGNCPSGTCGGGGTPGVCGNGTCMPKGCGSIKCGSTGDGCGNIIDCGTCPMGQVCGGMTPGQCSTPPCTPKTCGQQGYNCGSASDGCGNIIMCGACSGTQTCGGGGMANVCGGGAG